MGEIIRAFEAAVALAIVVVLVLVPGVAAANGTVVGIEAPAEVDEGGSFTARVIIDSVVDFDACNYDVTYDPAVIEVTDVTAGTINGTPIPVDLWGFIPSGVQGTVRVVQNVPLIPGVSGSGFLAEIHFDVVGAGGSSSAIDLGNGVMGDNYALEIIAGWTDGLVTVAGGGDGGSAPPSLPEPGVTPVETDDDGVFVEEVTAASEGGSTEVTIAKGTTGLTRDGEPLTEITVVPLEETPPPPEDTNVIGLNYDIGPDGATFDQAVTICFTYDPGEVPDGVEEEDLVVAVWDEGAGEWVDLEGCVVDTEAHRVCASVTHFTAFSVMAHTAPALFITESLVISPGSVEVGQMLTIVVTVTNLGDLEGSHEVVLKLDDIPSGEVVVMLGGGESREVSFSVSRDKGGPCRVNVDGQTGLFNVEEEVVVPELEEEAPVLAPAAFVVSDLMTYPGEVEAGADVSISVKVVNIGELEGTHEVKLKIDGIEVDRRDVQLAGGASEMVVFTVPEPVAGSHSVVVGDQAGEFTVSEKAPPVEEAAAPEEAPVAETARVMPWWLIGSVVGVVLVVVVAVWLTVLRRRT